MKQILTFLMILLLFVLCAAAQSTKSSSIIRNVRICFIAGLWH